MFWKKKRKKGMSVLQKDRERAAESVRNGAGAANAGSVMQLRPKGTKETCVGRTVRCTNKNCNADIQVFIPRNYRGNLYEAECRVCHTKVVVPVGR